MADIITSPEVQMGDWEKHLADGLNLSASDAGLLMPLLWTLNRDVDHWIRELKVWVEHDCPAWLIRALLADRGLPDLTKEMFQFFRDHDWVASPRVIYDMAAPHKRWVKDV